MHGAFLSGSLTLTPRDGSDPLTIEQKYFVWTSTYEISRRGQVIVTLTQDLAFFSQAFTLDVPGPNDFTIESTALMGTALRFTRPEEGLVGHAVTEGMLGTVYAVTIEPGQDDALILASIVAIDRILSSD